MYFETEIVWKIRIFIYTLYMFFVGKEVGGFFLWSLLNDPESPFRDITQYNVYL